MPTQPIAEIIALLAIFVWNAIPRKNNPTRANSNLNSSATITHPHTKSKPL
jgi:hypothetical protein